MGRDLDLPDRLPPEPVRPGRLPARELEVPPLSRERSSVELGGYRYQVSPKETEVLRDIGRFRTIAIQDLERYRYPKRSVEMREDLESLHAQGLVREISTWTGGQEARGQKLTVAVLTKRGQELIEQDLGRDASQKLFSGLVKPAEVRHDAAIYRMYQLEAERIRRSGGQVRRIVLDYELKQNVYRPLAKARSLPPPDYARRQAEIAAQNQLKVVHGKILLPDLRIEYERASGELAHVDLELASEHYRGGQMRGKAEAGFKFYAPADSIARLSSAFDPEFAVEILSL